MKLPKELQFMANARKKQKTSNESMKSKLSVVSGSTSGVGLAAVRRLAMAGSDIVLVVRNEDKAKHVQEELEIEYGVTCHYVIADFSDLNDVRKAAQIILDQFQRIDVLINSVGIHNTRKEIVDGVEKVFLVNHLSVFLFTSLLLDRIKENPQARIIQVNSEGHRFSGVKLKDINFKRRLYSGLRSYGQAKSAQLLTTWKFNELLRDTGVTINAMHPGAVKSAIGQNNGWLYRMYTKYILWHFLKDVKIAGEALYYLASSKELQGVSGKFFNLTIEEEAASHALKKDLIEPVWEISKQLTDKE
jgi:NAD(P)-dependent dehydrogenase (short-subunit alcohol dehydrogenase family)